MFETKKRKAPRQIMSNSFFFPRNFSCQQINEHCLWTFSIEVRECRDFCSGRREESGDSKCQEAVSKELLQRQVSCFQQKTSRTCRGIYHEDNGATGGFQRSHGGFYTNSYSRCLCQILLEEDFYDKSNLSMWRRTEKRTPPLIMIVNVSQETSLLGRVLLNNK
jgi:hypothetical protein